MEDDDEVDVEGDFDINIGTDQETLPNLYIDINEPPSKSANLLPEYTTHPWLLEQGWSLQLENVADEKSKAAIEKMLQEEQQYMNGKITLTKVASGKHGTSGSQKQTHQKRSWTEEEKVTFLKGLEIYGRSWSKIADLIPGKTVQQVKSFGQHYFKMKAREEEEIRKKDQKNAGNVKTQLPIGIQNAIRAVTTAQPTVKVSPKKLSAYYSNASSVWTEPDVQKKLPIKQMSTKIKKETLKRPPVKRKAQRQEKVKNEVKSKIANRNKTSPGNKKDKLTDVVNSKEIKIEPLSESYSTEEENSVDKKLLNILIEGSEVVRIPRNDEDGSDESDVEIDIDVETDDDASMPIEHSNPEMDMVYKKLVESAGIANAAEESEQDSDDEDEDDDDGVQNVDSMEEGKPSQGKADGIDFNASQNNHLDGIHNQKNEHEETKHDTKPCLVQTFSSSELNHNLNRYPSIGSIFESQPESSSEEECSKQEAISPDQESKIESDEDSKQENRTWEASEPSEEFTIIKEIKKEEYGWEESDGSQHRESADSSGDEDEGHDNAFGILTSLGELVYLPNPEKEEILEREEISDLERKIHCEFFNQKAGAKTPDRYLKIRNFILDAWVKCRPQYLNKTSVRPGLKNCGDVNCIGRIHSYLEQTGAINFGCSQVQYRRAMRSVQLKAKSVKDTELSSRTEFIRVRKRRVRDVQGEWVDERDLEGKTIEHKEKDLTARKPKIIRIRSSYDPFKLIPCQDFSESNPAPYKLLIESRALVTMDVHSHMSKTEVIGLLGGEFSSETGVMHISTAVPCRSVSTGMQCEMDPVSQTEACDAIQEDSQRVVGWYHSHPTFTPNPSCRDIETQEKYQEWFGKGGNPFLGIIVSPYSAGNRGDQSTVRSLLVVNEDSSTQDAGLPYQFNFYVVHERWDSEVIKKQVEQLVDTCSKSASRVHLLKHYSPFSRVTCLEKMIHSVLGYIPESLEKDREELRNMIENVVVCMYTSDPDIQEKLSENNDESDCEEMSGSGENSLPLEGSSTAIGL